MLVFVYKNLHKNLWSIKALEGPLKGKVIGYAKEAVLSHPIPKVSEKGRQRVLRDRKKNVHAGLVGELAAVVGYQERLPTPSFEFIQLTRNIIISEDSSEIVYNPYKYTAFVLKDRPNTEYLGQGTATLRHDGTVTVLHGLIKKHEQQFELEI